jgi:hypothetical protein
VHRFKQALSLQILCENPCFRFAACVLLSVAWLLLGSPTTFAQQSDQLRIWTDDSGAFKVEAVYLNSAEGTVNLKRSDGVLIEVPLSRLSMKDQQYVKSIQQKKQQTIEQGTDPSGVKPGKKVVEGLPDPNCRICRGSGITPLDQFRPYIFFVGKLQRKEIEKIGFCACPECQLGVPLSDIDPTVNADIDDKRHSQWQERLGSKLQEVETHYYQIHSQLDNKTTQSVAEALEKMQRHLQLETGSMMLIPCRRLTHEIVLLKNKKNYFHFLDVAKELRTDNQYPVDWEIMKQRHSSWLNQTLFTYDFAPDTSQWLPNAVVYTTSYYQIESATNWNAPDWLATGFGAYNEYNLFQVNLNYPVEYRFNDPQLVPNWNKLLNEFAQQGKLEDWNSLFERQIRDYQPIDYVQCKSVVSFLFSKPQSFLDYIMLLKNGTNQYDAIEKAYKTSMDDLEAQWKKQLR